MTTGTEGTIGVEETWATQNSRRTASSRTDDTPGADSDHATVQRLLDATDDLVRTGGVRRVSMSEVARTAGVARGTLYRYFDSRESLLEALRKRTTTWFFADVATKMDAESTLADQLGVFAKVIVETVTPRSSSTHSDEHTNRAAMVHILGTQGSRAVVRTAEFLAPYIESARDRGEVHRQLHTAEASSWVARVLLSFSIFRVESDAYTEVELVGSLVRRYLLGGLSDPVD